MHDLDNLQALNTTYLLARSEYLNANSKFFAYTVKKGKNKVTYDKMLRAAKDAEATYRKAETALNNALERE